MKEVEVTGIPTPDLAVINIETIHYNNSQYHIRGTVTMKTKVCLLSSCLQEYVPRRSDQKYCRNSHRVRAYQKRLEKKI